MADGYVLSIWKHGTAPDDGGTPVRLFEFETPEGDDDPTLVLVAEHDQGVDDADVQLADGTLLSFSNCLKPAELARDDRVAAIGDELWRRIAQGAVGEALQPVATTSRIHLDLRSPELLRCPWEMLRIDDSTPFTKFGARWSIGSPLRGDGLATPPDHPIRIMIVVGNNPADGLQSDGEVRKIEAAANGRSTEILLRTLTHPSAETVANEVRKFRPHIFHFIGHGAMAGGAPHLLVHRPGNNNFDKWTAQNLNDVFSPAPPRLVVLNACFAGTSDNNAASLPRAFTDLGTIAVIAMTEEILTDAAIGFTADFYTQILGGTPVDKAATEARRAIRSATSAREGVNVRRLQTSWPLVRLTVQGSADTAVAKTCTGPNKRNWLTQDFIARWHERHTAWQAIDGTKTRLAVLWGSEQSGRKELLNCLADSCARGGDVVLMVELAEDESGTWRDVISAIASTAAQHPDVHADTLVEIAGRPGDRTRIMRDFLTELEACSDDRRLLVAIDGLGGWNEDLVEDLVVDLCNPFGTPGADGTTRLAITLAESGNGVDLGLPADAWRPIQVQNFKADEWPRGLELFIERLAEDDDDRRVLAELSAALLPFHGPSATVLEMVRKYAKMPKAKD